MTSMTRDPVFASDDPTTGQKKPWPSGFIRRKAMVEGRSVNSVAKDQFDSIGRRTLASWLTRLAASVARLKIRVFGQRCRTRLVDVDSDDRI